MSDDPAHLAAPELSLESEREMHLPQLDHRLRDAELDEIASRRKKVFGEEAGIDLPTGAEEDGKSRVEQLTTYFSRLHKAEPFGLSFSGGGIRSATFNLGILQGLAEHKLLPYVDYLSTVSGGGYLGAWLHGVIRNQHEGDPRSAAQFLSPTTNPIPTVPEKDPISFLRKYSNYLAAKPGLFSADSWVIAVIWLRNVILNQLILIPALSLVIVSLLILGFVEQNPGGKLWNSVESGFNLAAAVGSLIALLGAVAITVPNLISVVDRTFASESEKEATQGTAPGSAKNAERYSLWTVPLVFLASILIGCGQLDNGTHWFSRGLLATGLLGLFLVFQLVGGFRKCYRSLHATEEHVEAAALFHVIWMPIASALVTTLLISLVWMWTASGVDGNMAPWLKLAYAPPLVCLSLLGGVSLQIGLMGGDYPDAAREWLARIGAMLALCSAAWAGLFTISVFGPWAMSWLLAKYGRTGITVIGMWVLTTVGGVLAGRRGESSGTKESSQGPGVLARVMNIAPTVFMIGYLLLLAFGVHAALKAASGFQHYSPSVNSQPDPKTYKVAVGTNAGVQVSVGQVMHEGFLTRTFARFAGDYFDVLSVHGSKGEMDLQPARFLWLLGFFIAFLVIASIASLRININEFSMHHFYKNRLVRCYLGASNSKTRDPNKLTGFDPKDDFSLSSLSSAADSKARYWGPYPIINATLNLNTGSELAQQERKAASFVFTPRYCGFHPNVSREDIRKARNTPAFREDGFQETRGYAYNVGPQVGTTIAISGAAANPNSGYHTSGPMAFLLTVFDARLGWWLGNPRWNDASKLPSPSFALWYLLAELFAQSNGRSKFVNLSDGGHYDNLGLYELVRRRCRYIIVGDGEQDGDLTFGSLGTAIRLCRADFGVEIDINPDPIRIKNGFSTAHCVVGTITYPEDETAFTAGMCEGERREPRGKARGWLLYLKSSLTGDEPADVIEYRSRNPEFPHQNTSNQFFTESQFESYRRLGLHIVRDAFEDVEPELKDEGTQELLKIFQGLTRKWYAPIPVSDELAGRLANEYSNLLRRLGENPDFTVFEGLLAGRQSTTAPVTQLTSRCFLFGMEAIQLMENVYTSFGFQHGANQANPRNAGWMGVFDRWCKNDVLYHHVWLPTQTDYNPLFGQFVEDRHNGVEYRK